METTVNPALADVILNSLHDGLYVCDTDRRILYWSKGAERITGWSSHEVVGRCCRENILAHVDKDGRRLCGEEFCPLHRSMHTDKASSSSIVVFGQTRTGKRMPMAVSVAPVHDSEGRVIGGVEIFQDFSETYSDLQRAKQIQILSMDHDLPKDDRIGFSPYYLPHDMIGGDFIGIRQLDADRYGFILADVMGHGVAAALYTMYLSALWGRFSQDLIRPSEFALNLNRELCKIVKDESFATAVCGVVDISRRIVKITSAGGPPILMFSADGNIEQIDATGCPFGMIDYAGYDESEYLYSSGDRLLAFSDGAIELQDAREDMLGAEGLVRILKSLSYPESGINIEALQRELLTYSNEIRLDDDLTLLEIRFS